MAIDVTAPPLFFRNMDKAHAVKSNNSIDVMIVVPTTRDDLEGLLLLQMFNLDFPSGWCYVVTLKAVSLKQALNSGSRLLSHTGNVCCPEKH